MTQNVGKIEYIVTANTSGLLRADKQVVTVTNHMQQGFDAADSSVQSLTSSFGRLSSVASGVLTALSANEVLKYADAWTTLSNKLVNSVSANESLVDVTNRVFDISQQTRTELDATATLYGRLERSTRKYNLTAEQLGQLTTTINQGLIVSGATTEEAASSMTQLSQALASGVLRGEEFNSLTENGSRLAMALADSLGVDIGQLRAMAAAGQLTTKIVIDGLLKQGVPIAAEFAKTTQTLGQSFTVATNNITKFVGESATVQSTVAGIGSAVITVSENIDTLAVAFTGLAVVMGSRFAGALAAAAAAQVKNTFASVASAKAAAASAQSDELAAAAKLRVAKADKSAAISALNVAQARLNTLKATGAASIEEVKLAAAEAATIRTQIAQIDSEKALEKTRLQAQITEQGRIATATRMAQLQQASAVLTSRLATAEATAAQARSAAIVTAEAEVSAARIATANAADVATAANGRYMASQEASVIANRAASASLGVLRAAMGLLGGPAGIVTIVAAGLYLWYQSAQQAKTEALALADNIDTLADSYKNLNQAQLQGKQAQLEESVTLQKDAIADLKDEVEDTARVMDIYGNRLSSISKDSPEYESAQRAYEQAVRDNKIAVAELDTAQEKLAKTGGVLAQVNEWLAGNMDELSAKARQLANDVKALTTAQPEQRSAKGDVLLKQIQEENELLKITDKRQRAVASARQKALDKGVEAGSQQLQEIEAVAAAHYDLQQQENKGKKATSTAAKEASKLATQQQAVTSKLDDLRQKSEQSGNSTRELSRQQAILTAQQSLGNSATKEQITLAGQYAAKIWDTRDALKQKQQAEQGNKFAKQEIAAAKVDVNPLTGVAEDPLAQINQQEQQKLDALAKYHPIGLQQEQTYEDAKTAIMQQAANERARIAQDEADKQQQYTSQVLGVVASSFDSLASIIASSGGETSNAYRALFAISKGFAIAQATLNTFTAVSNALALPFPANIPAMAQAAASGAQLASTISGISYSGGRRYGGGVSAGNQYRINENGESEVFQTAGGQQAFIPNKSGKVIPASDVVGSGNGAGVNIVINNTAPRTTVENQGYNSETKTVTLAVKEVARQLSNRTGDVSRGLETGYNVTGKAG